MFYYIEGIVSEIHSGLVVVDTGGVGYACHASGNTLGRLKQGAKMRVYTYLNVHEDVFEIYGFATLQEKKCFEMLIGVTGVGPKAALSILSVAPPDRLTLAIVTGDDKLLQQASGIGKKIAQRIVLELRDKMSKEQQARSSDSAAIIEAVTAMGRANHTQEAVAALMVLGYSQAEALQAMEGLDAASLEADEIIRACLKKLASG